MRAGVLLTSSGSSVLIAPLIEETLCHHNMLQEALVLLLWFWAFRHHYPAQSRVLGEFVEGVLFRLWGDPLRLPALVSLAASQLCQALPKLRYQLGSLRRDVLQLVRVALEVV